MTNPEGGRTSSIRLFPLSVGVFTTIMGLTVLVGWAWNLPLLKTIFPGYAAMKANTAVGMVLLGLGLWLSQIGVTARRLGRLAAAAAVMLGVTTLLEYALVWDAGIDQLLFKDISASGGAFPGRPSHATAFNLMILGVGLLGFDAKGQRCFTTFMAILASLVSWIAMNGYVFSAKALYGLGLYSSIALHTATLFFLFSLGLMAMQPACAPTRILFSQGIGGTLSRWLLPFAVIAPPVLGWLFRRLNALGIYHADFSWALYSVSTSVGSVILILLLAHRLITIDAARAKATELSRHDPLTGLPNRRAFDDFIIESFRLARRHARPLAMLMLDIDHFKHYNDAFGHPAGDQALIITARVLNEHARETDLVARVGGEEFAIVLPETDLEGALLLAERIREDIEQSAAYLCPMTISIGAAGIADNISDTAMFIKESDDALYSAKQSGRNCVSWRGVVRPELLPKVKSRM